MNQMFIMHKYKIQSMNEDATIKIFSKIQSIERDLQVLYHDYFNGVIEENHFIIMNESTERDLQIHYYIYNLIIQDARKN